MYVSEMVAQTMNPTFRHVDWSACGPGVMRTDHLTLRFWAKSSKVEDWRQLLELSLNLQSLHYLGKSVRSVSQMRDGTGLTIDAARPIPPRSTAERCHLLPH